MANSGAEESDVGHAKRQVVERVVLHGVSWDVYEALLREIGDQHLYLTYGAPLPA